MAVIMNAPFCYQKNDETLWTADDMIQKDEDVEDGELLQLANMRLAEAKAMRSRLDG